MTFVVPNPPLAEDLPLGAKTLVGLGEATVVADMDFETFSLAGFEWNDEKGKWGKPAGAPLQKKGLEITGLANYVSHPSFRVLHLSYNLKNGQGRRRWRPGLPNPEDLFAYLRSGGLIEAWNCGFEEWVWDAYCVPVLGWPEIPDDQWRCAMAKSRAHSLPGKLEKAGEVLNLRAQKDDDGSRLLDKFSIPRNPTKDDPRLVRPTLWTQEDVDGEFAKLLAFHPGATPAKVRKLAKIISDDAVDSAKLADYNDGDISSEAEASFHTPDLSPAELRYWQDDRAINKLGVQIDVDSMHCAIAIVEQALKRYGEKLQELTGGILPTEVERLLGWLRGRGVFLDALDEDAVEEALKGPLPDDCREALRCRSAVASASVKKLYSMRLQVTAAGRLHDLYVFHGARTGRPTGYGAQPTNLPRYGPEVTQCPHCGGWHGAHTLWCPWCQKINVRKPKSGKEWNPDAMEWALRAISYRSLDFLELAFGDALLTIAGCLRGLFIATKGKELTSSDFSAIEGVVIAALAGQQWRLNVFAGHGKIYEMSAAKIVGISFEEMMAHAGYHDLSKPEWWKEKQTGPHHPARQRPGKIAELALGFGGWIPAWRQFGGEGTDDEIKGNIIAWREASSAIVHLWGGQKGGPGKKRGEPNYFGLEGMAVSAVMNPGNEYKVYRLDGTDSGISYFMKDDVLYCKVPSGGIITYHRPRLAPAREEWRGLSFSYEGWNTNPKSGPIGWIRMNAYGGKFGENVTQKVARDKQMNAIHRVRKAGYPVVMHTYDEIVSEHEKGFGSVEHFESLMAEYDSWNVGWPIKAAGGWRAERYRKG